MSLGFKGANRVDMSLNLKTAINNAQKMKIGTVQHLQSLTSNYPAILSVSILQTSSYRAYPHRMGKKMAVHLSNCNIKLCPGSSFSKGQDCAKQWIYRQGRNRAIKPEKKSWNGRFLQQFAGFSASISVAKGELLFSLLLFAHTIFVLPNCDTSSMGHPFQVAPHSLTRPKICILCWSNIARNIPNQNGGF